MLSIIDNGQFKLKVYKQVVTYTQTKWAHFEYYHLFKFDVQRTMNLEWLI